MRVLTMCLGIGIALAAACGGDSSKNGTNSNGRDTLTGQCTATSATQTCTGEAAFEQCMQGSCDSQLKAAFGSGYAGGAFTGPCAAYMNCQMACPCDANAPTCESNCTSQLLSNSSCMTVIMAVSSCMTSAGCVEPVCTSTTGTGTGANTGTGTGLNTATYTNIATSTDTATYTNLTTATATGGCAAAGQCCNTLAAMGGTAAAQTAQQCATIATMGDAACNQILGIWQTYGFCN